MKELKNIFLPNKVLSKKTFFLLVGVQSIAVLLFWFLSKATYFPSIPEIFNAMGRLMREEDLVFELLTSTGLCLQSLAIAVVISLIISYLSVIPFFKPFAFIVSKFRFLTLVGLSFLFVLMTHSGHGLKVSLMVFGITVFFVTSLVAEIQGITKNEFNHARTLRMSEWEVVKEVIILGRLDKVMEIIRQTFAISWMMLTMVEGISRAEGGVGTLLLNQNKHFNLDAVFAIQLVILVVGIFMDYMIGFLKNLFFPFATLTTETK
ncbi:MAG: hypothetical protein K1X55_09275 [Chitinophagales bacterium]|nr:hypothetical protein [Chitinophagales bacterium]